MDDNQGIPGIPMGYFFGKRPFPGQEFPLAQGSPGGDREKLSHGLSKSFSNPWKGPGFPISPLLGHPIRKARGIPVIPCSYGAGGSFPVIN